MRDSFVMYTDWSDQFELLDDVQRSMLIMAIFSYQKGEELPELDSTTAMAFSFIKKSLDKDTAKWEAAIKQRSDAGKKSAESRRRNATKSTTVESVETRSTKSTDNVPVSVNDSDNNNPPIVPPRGKYESEFVKLWNLYPRKEGKKKAMDAYVKARKHGTTYEEVESGINKYLDHIKQSGTDQKYIKMGSTYFNQQSWTDEYSWKPPNSKFNNFDQPKDVYSPEMMAKMAAVEAEIEESRRQREAWLQT